VAPAPSLVRRGRGFFLQLLTRLRPAQRGLDKLDEKWYSVNNGGECAVAPDPAKDAQKWPNSSWE
jgi:hypothetical protein